MSFLDKLNSLMIQKGLNNHSLSVQSGIPYTTIDGWYKKGYESAKLSTVKKLSDFFGVSLDYFVDGKSDINNKISANTEEIYIDSTIRKYAQLDEFGKKAVKAVTNIEYERCTVKANDNEETAENQFRQIQLSLLPVSAGFGSFLDSNDSEGISIPATEEYRQVDFAVRVSGDSMEPEYHNGDIVLVREQPSVEVGEVGLFTVDNMGYIKEQGEDRLISRNPDYSDIYPNEYENVKCWGKVVGVLK